MEASIPLKVKPTIAEAKNNGGFYAKLKVAKTKTNLQKKGLKLNNTISNKGGVDPFVELKVEQIMERQTIRGSIPKKETPFFQPQLLQQSYETCRQICAQRSTTYYLGSLLMTEERKKAVWAVYGWGQMIDDLVDNGAKSKAEVAAALDSWEHRLHDIFHGRPHDLPDIALTHTFQKFSLDIQPFQDLIKGMKMDTWKMRYDTYDELELYCCYVAATGCLMAIPIVGISQEYTGSTRAIYEASLSLGIANQLSNILRDVSEDASRGRIYLPQDELREYGLTDEDIFSKNVTEEWREFTKMQIQRARRYYDQGDQVAAKLHVSGRWPVRASIMLYRKILDKIENNNYDNLTKRASVGTAEKALTLPLAYAKAMPWFPFLH